MSITVTGATGPFGRRAIEALLRRGVPAGQIMAVGRNVAKIAGLSGRGVTVRRADYDDPSSAAADRPANAGDCWGVLTSAGSGSAPQRHERALTVVGLSRPMRAGFTAHPAGQILR
jgi:NAD(P)H dehydrogenase (quinone)